MGSRNDVVWNKDKDAINTWVAGWWRRSRWASRSLNICGGNGLYINEGFRSKSVS